MLGTGSCGGCRAIATPLLTPQAPRGYSLMANASRCRTHDSRTHGLTCLLGNLPSKDGEPKHRQGGGFRLSRVSWQRLVGCSELSKPTEQSVKAVSVDIFRLVSPALWHVRSFAWYVLRPLHCIHEETMIKLGICGVHVGIVGGSRVHEHLGICCQCLLHSYPKP